MPPFPDKFASAQIYFFTFINFGIVYYFQIIVLYVTLNFSHHQVLYYCHQKTEIVSSKGVVTNYGEGGATKREGGACEVLPLRKGGAEKV